MSGPLDGSIWAKVFIEFSQIIQTMNYENVETKENLRVLG